MKTRHSIRNVRTNLEDTKAFTITSNSKSFRILSDNLYSDKIKAIIRELSCNAYDAHISAGKADEPFEVTLPNRQDPTFTIRDYGVGMDHDFVLELYTTYFGSDKSDSNDFVGVLGLGSKSPFSYTDSFVVSSIKEGVKRCYTCFIDEDGIPNISMLSEEDTRERTGVEIKFAVNYEDFDAFHNKCASVFKHFKNHPIINGHYERSEKNYRYSGRDWQFYDQATGLYDNLQLAIMGNVAYPIDQYQLPGDLSEKEDFMFANSFEIEFEIGELDITPSREALSYDETTVANLRRKIAKAYCELMKKIEARISKCETLWEAKTELKSITRGFSHTSKIHVYYNGTHLDTNSIRIKAEDRDFEVVAYSGSSIYSSRMSRQSLSKWDWSWRKYYEVSLDSIFILNDQKRKGVSKARALAEEQSSSVYLLDANEKTFLNKLGNPPAKRASEINNPYVDSPSARSNKRYYFAFVNASWRGWDLHTSFSDAKDYEDIKNQKMRYIIRNKKNEYVFKEGGKTYTARNMQSILNTAVQAGIVKENIKVYAVHKYEFSKKRFQQNKNFKPLGAYLKRKTQALLRKQDVHQSIIAKKRDEMLFREMDRNDVALLENEHIAAQVSDDSEYSKMRNLLITTREQRNDEEIDEVERVNLSSALELARYLDISAYKENEVEIPKIKPLSDFYPMLQLVRYSHWINYEDIVADYINTVERSKS